MCIRISLGAVLLVAALGCALALTVTGAARAYVYDPANGHYYGRVDVKLTWAGARDAARTTTYNGMPGHLATITSADENKFIVINCGGGLVRGAWLGGYQLPGSTEPDGGWTWVTGEPWVYTNWGPGEPHEDPYWPTVDSLTFLWNTEYPLGTWNDEYGMDPFPASGNSYIIEFEPVPEPSSLAVLLVGLAGAGGTLRRRR